MLGSKRAIASTITRLRGRSLASITIQLRALTAPIKESDRIKALQNRITPNAEVEKFADNASVEQVWDRLTREREDGQESSTRKWANVLIREKIVSSEQEMIDFMGTLKFQGRAVSDVRREFKDHYRPELLNLINSQATSELRYQKMRQIAESLDVQSQGDFSESWYQQEFAPSRIDPNSGKQVPNTTQAVLSVEDARINYGIELETKENRRFDEVFGSENSATIREHKHVSGKLGADQITQFDDNIQIVQHNRRIDEKIAGGEPLSKSPQDTPVIIEKDGKKFRPKQVMYTFATPEGVKANRKWMIAELNRPSNRDILSFEIINSKGEKKLINKNNISDLEEQKLSQWLNFTPSNNSINAP